MPKYTSRDDIRQALSGPIASMRIPFARDGEIDYASLRNSIDFDVSAGTKTLLLTYGDSLFSLLTDQEVADITKAVVEHAAGRAMVVAADRQWATPKAVEFAQYARDIGADVVMVLPPNWGSSATAETLVEHYATVATHMPVMVVTGAFVARPAMGLEVIERLINDVPDVVAVKDDVCGEFARRLCSLAHADLAVFSGGQKQNHLDVHPYGCDGYLSTFLTFKPDIAHAYWDAIEAGDIAAAAEVIRRYDRPYFDFVFDLPGGFDAGIHGTLELFGIAPRWRRKPYHSPNDAEMERLADFLRRLSLL